MVFHHLQVDIEDIFTLFEILTWLLDFHLGMNPFVNITAWPVWAEATHYIGVNTIISSFCKAFKNANKYLTI